MAKFFETPPGVSTVDIRKRINGMLSEVLDNLSANLDIF